MCGPVLPILGLAAGTAAGVTAVKKAGDILSPKIDMPAPPGPGENVEASAQNAARNAQRKALMAKGQRSTVLTGYGGARSPSQGKTLLGQ